MTKTITGYKFITKDMKSKDGIQAWKLGKWVKYDGKLELCKSGLHASETPLESLNYAYGDRWFKIEARGKINKDGAKFVASEMRLVQEIDVKKVLIRFAIICARESLPNYEKIYKDDLRPRQAIEATEAYLANPNKENESAARSAAWSARSAAWSAESAVRSAESAAWSAAWSARSAAWSAVRSAESAAWSAESAWSARSAESAVRSAESAARSARSAARSARSAVRSAAESAAKQKCEKWQNSELLKLIEGF